MCPGSFPSTTAPGIDANDNTLWIGQWKWAAKIVLHMLIIKHGFCFAVDIIMCYSGVILLPAVVTLSKGIVQTTGNSETREALRMRTGTKHYYSHYDRKWFIYFGGLHWIGEVLMRPHPSFLLCSLWSTQHSKGLNCRSVHFKWLASSPVLHALGHYANVPSPCQQTPLLPVCNQM